jgi:hypothetical protein
MNPPQHAAVFCFDEKTAIQALDRMDPVLPLSPGRAEKHGFEYFRHGTLSLYAALDVKTGKVHGKAAHRHTSADFIGFLADIVERNPPGKELHIVLDNLSAHKTHAVREFFERNPQGHPEEESAQERTERCPGRAARPPRSWTCSSGREEPPPRNCSKPPAGSRISLRGFISGTLSKEMSLTVTSSEDGERTYSIKA